MDPSLLAEDRCRGLCTSHHRGAGSSVQTGGLGGGATGGWEAGWRCPWPDSPKAAHPLSYHVMSPPHLDLVARIPCDPRTGVCVAPSSPRVTLVRSGRRHQKHSPPWKALPPVRPWSGLENASVTRVHGEAWVPSWPLACPPLPRGLWSPGWARWLSSRRSIIQVNYFGIKTKYFRDRKTLQESPFQGDYLKLMQ